MSMDLIFSWLLTYWVHSTIALAGVWLASALLRQRNLALEEGAWKAAMFLTLLTATLQLGLTSSTEFRPLAGALEWAAARDSQPIDRSVGDPRPFNSEFLASTIPQLEGSGALGDASRLSSGAVSSEVPLAETERTSNGIRPEVSPARNVLFGGRAPFLIAVFWLAVTAALAAKLLVSYALFARRLRDRRPVLEGSFLTMLSELKGRVGVLREVGLSICERLSVPLALGFRNWEVCLPARLTAEFDADEQETVLAHELAHLVRRDTIWLLAARALAGALFFQPLNFLALARLGAISELRCDDWAVANTGRPVTLARCLTRVAGWRTDRWASSPVPAMAGASRSHFGTRVRRLLSRSYPQPPARVPVWVKGAMIPMVVLFVAAAPGIVQRSHDVAAPQVAPVAPVPVAAPEAPAALAAAAAPALAPVPVSAVPALAPELPSAPLAGPSLASAPTPAREPVPAPRVLPAPEPVAVPSPGVAPSPAPEAVTHPAPRPLATPAPRPVPGPTPTPSVLRVTPPRGSLGGQAPSARVSGPARAARAPRVARLSPVFPEPPAARRAPGVSFSSPPVPLARARYARLTSNGSFVGADEVSAAPPAGADRAPSPAHESSIAHGRYDADDSDGCDESDSDSDSDFDSDSDSDSADSDYELEALEEALDDEIDALEEAFESELEAMSDELETQMESLEERIEESTESIFESFEDGLDLDVERALEGLEWLAEDMALRSEKGSLDVPRRGRERQIEKWERELDRFQAEKELRLEAIARDRERSVENILGKDFEREIERATEMQQRTIERRIEMAAGDLELAARGLESSANDEERARRHEELREKLRQSMPSGAELAQTQASLERVRQEMIPRMAEIEAGQAEFDRSLAEWQANYRIDLERLLAERRKMIKATE